MLKTLTVALVAALPISTASVAMAAPAASPSGLHATTIQLVDLRRDNHRNDKRHVDRSPSHRFTPGQRYRSAPRGWRSYRGRPGDWRTRGCILVGPLWFCP
ncbi:hypothetical protein ACFQI3_09140 [Hansschlegelia quercus]|uniref:Secreted protein n=1 Tax=Hansschlegelia quercus TaxID=2528245 RepID=A0A4Q9GM94_9HYPH|nr:hypothetical protein [Hansschlegelia quercus]TBN54245.1 hypothetical protein EYR15_05215 [Hansschlegelia quercus]